MSTIVIKANDDFKAKAKAFANYFGLPLGTLMKMLMQEAMRNGKISFSKPEIPNVRLAKSIRDAECDILDAEKAGDWSKFNVFNSAEEMILSQKEEYGDM